MTDAALDEARSIVLREGWLLDTRQWDEWLSLYHANATYWLPCWLEDGSLTSDPTRQMSLIYYSGRSGLEDRVYRIRTEQSLAAIPLPRTCHITSIISVERENSDIRVESNWIVQSVRLDKQHAFFGQQTHMLHEGPVGWRISSRRVVLANDVIPNVLDIYSV